MMMLSGLAGSGLLKWSMPLLVTLLAVAPAARAKEYPAKQPDDSFFERLPTVGKIYEEVQGKNDMDTAARRAAAYAIVESALEEFSGNSLLPPISRETPEEGKRLAPLRQAHNGYGMAAGRTEAQYTILAPPCTGEDCDKTRFLKAKWGYVRGPFAREFLKTYVGEALADAWVAAVELRTKEAEAARAARVRTQSSSAPPVAANTRPAQAQATTLQNSSSNAANSGRGTSEPKLASLISLLAQADGGTACAACSGAYLIVIIGFFALSIALLVWVFKDAKRRGMETPVLWMLVVFFTNLVGLIIYLLARPSGDLVECPQCHEKRLASLPKCPHCGQS